MGLAERPRRRRWWVWLIGAAVVLLAATAAFSNVDAHDFSFLDRFHPLIAVPKKDTIYIPPGDKAVIYFFDRENTPKVHRAMKAELTKKGYSYQCFGTESNETEAYERNVGAEQQLAIVYDEKAGKQLVQFTGVKAAIPPRGCIVIVLRSSTWLERQLDAVKKFLHWD